MEKITAHTPDLTSENIKKIAEIFPNCVSETLDPDGVLKRAVVFDQLRQELSTSVIEEPQERYQLNWPGKREALLTANAPIAKTLRPFRLESVDFDTTKNLFIEGDNLDALKLLQETYLNKIKMIYIDPPYNTGNDFIYKDDFAENIETYLQRSNQKDEAGNRMMANTEANGRYHSDWLTMMYSRLKLARNLLKENGLIFISIDSNEVSNLKLLMDEIYGGKNLIGIFPTIMNLKGNNDAFAFSDTHEFTLVYAKSKIDCTVNQLPISEEYLEQWDEDERGIFKRADTLRRTGQDASRARRPKGWFPVFITDKNEIYVTESDQPKSPKDIVLWPLTDSGDELSWTWSKKKIMEESYNLMVVEGRNGKNIYKKQRPSLGDLPTSKPKSIIYKPEYSSSNGTAEVAKLFGKKIFDSPKPLALLRDFLIIGTEKDSIILDFFSGTATAAHAVMALNAADEGTRSFIMVQLPEKCDPKSEAFKSGYKTIADIGKERIRLAGKMLKKESIEQLDIGFRVLKIDSSNMTNIFHRPDSVRQSDLFAQIDNIREGRTDEDLLFQVLLDWGVDLSLPIIQENICGKSTFFVDTNALAACFETNLDEEFMKKLAERHPLRVVFKDASFHSDSVKINVEQIFKLISPSTEVRSI